MRKIPNWERVRNCRRALQALFEDVCFHPILILYTGYERLPNCLLTAYFFFRRFSRISWSRRASRSSSWRFSSANSRMILS